MRRPRRPRLYRQASALDLPFAPERFEGAYLFHVCMNIDNKSALFAEVRKILAPSGKLGICDIMRIGAGDLSYPVLWVTSAATSFVADADTYRRLLEAAGFAVLKERSRHDFALEVFRQMRSRDASGRPAPHGLHIVTGENAGKKVLNMMHDIEQGLIAPTKMICRVVQ